METTSRTLRYLPFHNGFCLANTHLLKRQNINFLLNVHVKNVTFAVLQIAIYAKPTDLVFSCLKKMACLKILLQEEQLERIRVKIFQ